MADRQWQQSLRLFFAGRAREVAGKPSLVELCFVSGRDPRLWDDQAIYRDLIGSIVQQLDVTDRSRVLEVGCAAGFLANGFAPCVREYVGADLAAPLLDVARRLQIPNAEFRLADGKRLPFADGLFDAAFCYDVVTNFPLFANIVPLLDEMLRVVRPGGTVLVGSVPDEAAREQYERRVAEVSAELARVGPLPALPPGRQAGLLWRIVERLRGRPAVQPGISCYYFSRQSFNAFAHDRKLALDILDIHSLNPYRGMRFNAVFRKPGP